MNERILQTIGFVGLALFIISYPIRSNRALFMCQMLGCIVFCIQMCLLGAFTGAIGLIVNILRNLLLILTIYTWSGLISLLPLASVGITTIGYWTNNAQKIRLSQLFGSPCALLYDILIRSWGGAASEAMTLVSIVISIFRFVWSSMGKNDAKF